MEIRKSITVFGREINVSNNGNIKIKTQVGMIKELKQHINKYGYVRVNICEGSKIHQGLVHRLVASAFLGLDLSKGREQCALHKNDIRSDNRVENIYVGTYKDNAIDRSNRNRGNSPKGSKNTASILKEDNVIEIKKLLRDGILKHGQIGSMFGVSRDAIQKIASGKNWKHINIVSL